MEVQELLKTKDVEINELKTNSRQLKEQLASNLQIINELLSQEATVNTKKKYRN